MPTVRLEFELDSEIYPELHAALAALRSPRARAERMRQLAAAGLVWEKVRLQGAAVTVEAMPAPVPVPAPSPPPPATVTVSPPARERRNRRPSRADVEQVMRELPVLMDVVADVRPLPLPEPHDDDMAHEEPAHWAAMNAYPDDIPTDSGDDDGTGLPDAALHVTALSHKPATRSRLMRMKERGLFKNG
jgi:hypothetical protein